MRLALENDNIRAQHMGERSLVWGCNQNMDVYMDYMELVPSTLGSRRVINYQEIPQSQTADKPMAP